MNILKILTVFIFAHYSLFTSHYLFAQKGSNCPEDVVPKLGENRMWGYANLFGQWVINPIYTKVSPYVENKAVVMKGLSYGVIDCEGNVILQAQYKKLSNFRYGKIWAQNKDGMWGLLNEKGGTLLDHQYSEINPIAFTELSWVKKGEVWGLLNEAKGSFICKPQFKIAQIMSENATLVQVSEPTFGVINHVNCEYLLNNITKVKKVAEHTIIFQQEGKWGVFNEWGKIVSNAEYDSIVVLKTVADPKTNSVDLVLLIQKNNFFGLININGKELLAPQYDEIAAFSNGFFRVKQKGKYGYANRLGKILIKPVYEDAGSFYDGKAIVKKNGKYGVIDFKNSFILAPQYNSIDRSITNKYFAVKEKGKFVLYSMDAKKLSNEIFDSVYISDSASVTRVVINSKNRYFNIESKNYSFEGVFDEAEKFAFGLALVSNDKKWGVIDTKGKVVVPLDYEKVAYERLANKLVFRTNLNGKLGLIDPSGVSILPNNYEMIVVAPPIFLKVKKDGKYGLLKNDGTPVTEFIYDFISNSLESSGIPEWPSIIVKKDKYGLMNEKGEEIYPPKAYKIEYVGEGNYSVKEKKNCGLLNSKCSNEYNAQYEIIREFGQGLAAARKKDKWGYITPRGEEKIKFEFEDAGVFINYMAPAKLNGLWGIIDVNGKFMIQPEYDKYFTMPDGTRKLYKGDKEFTLLKGGKLK